MITKTKGISGSAKSKTYHFCFEGKDRMRKHYSFAGVSKGSPYGTQLCLQSVVCYTALPTDVKNEVAPHKQTHFERQENRAECTSGQASKFRLVFRKAWRDIVLNCRTS